MKIEITRKEIEAMPAGEALNMLIQERVLKTVPLTDDEFILLRSTWMQSGPQWATQKRPFKVPLTKIELESLKWHMSAGGTWTIEPEIIPTFRLSQAQDYSANDWAMRGLIAHMREAGWLYEFAEMDKGKMKSVRFRRSIWKGEEFGGEIMGQAFAGTDELAVSRAALIAAIELEIALSNGFNVE